MARKESQDFCYYSGNSGSLNSLSESHIESMDMDCDQPAVPATKRSYSGKYCYYH